MGAIAAARPMIPTFSREPEGSHALSVCESKLASSDPGQYYGVMFAARERRAALVALYAFWQEVREIVDECREPEVARVKLGWWHEEVQAMAAGRPRHPATTALAPAMVAYDIPAESLLSLIASVGQRLGYANNATYAELCDYGLRTRGAIERLAARMAGCHEPAAGENVLQVGARLEMITLLRDTGADLRRNRCYLPREDLARFGVDPRDLSAGRAAAGLGELIAFEARRLREELGQHVERLTEAARPRLIPLLAAAAIAAALLERIHRHRDRVLHEQPALLTLRQLWIAWRVARRAGTADNRGS